MTPSRRDNNPDNAVVLGFTNLRQARTSRPVGDTINIAPPLIITEGEIDELVRRFHRTLDTMTEEAMTEAA